MKIYSDISLKDLSTSNTSDQNIYVLVKGSGIGDDVIRKVPLTVNGAAMSAGGNITTALTAVLTGPSASGTNNLIASSSGNKTGSLTNGTIWVVSNDSSTQADLRYVKLSVGANINQNITSSLIISGSSVTFSSSLFWSGASDLGGATSNVLVLGSDGKIYKTGSYGGGGGGGGTPGSPVNSIQYNSSNAFAGSSSFTFNGSTVNLTGSLLISGSTPLRAIGGTSTITGSLIVSNSLSVVGTGSITGSLAISSSTPGQTVLQITGTGSATTAPIVQIAGQTGGFVQVYDFNSGSLFSVNSNTGTAIVDVRSNGQTLIGSNTFQGMYDSTANIAFASPSQNLTTPGYLTSSYSALWFDYSVSSGSYSRMGTLYSSWSGSNISYNDVTGSYTGTVPVNNITLVTRFSSSFIQVTASAATNNWVIKGMIRCI